MRGFARAQRVCFVVTRSKRDHSPLHIALEFQDAREFVLSFNRVSATGKAVIRPARADIRYSVSHQMRVRKKTATRN